MDKKVLILYICFLIVTLVPASAIETSSIISQKTDDIKENQASIIEDKNIISQGNNAINYHVNIIRDTINGMNSVKWYQFWKWNFYINEGPKRIQDESQIVESLSNDLGKTATNMDQNANKANNIGNTSLQLGLNAANKVNQPNPANNLYNSGDAMANAYLIANHVSSKFNTNYMVTAKGDSKNGDIIQYRTSHGTYIYLEFIGLNPAGDTALFLGDSNTAVRLPVSAFSSIKYKIKPETNINTDTATSVVPINNNKTTPKNPLLTPVESQSKIDNIVVHYIATIQEDGLKTYNESGVNGFNSQINDKKDTRTTGSNLMIAGGVIGAVSIGMWTAIYFLIGFSNVCYVLSLICPAFAAGGIASTATMGILIIIAGVLAVTSATLLCTGGGIYATADSKIDELNGDKNTFTNGCNAIETDLESYYNGAINSLPVAQNLLIDAEENCNSTSTLNATDADGDGLIYTTVLQPRNGIVKVDSNGTYTYIPNRGFVGNESFTYRANDLYGDSNTATVNITVHPFNHPPISSNMMFDIETNTNLTGQLKATDQDGDPITYTLLNNTSYGNITVKPDGTFTYTPINGFIGNDTFTYIAKDWKENGNIATVQINVHPINNLPVTHDINLTVAKNENITYNILANDEDGDNLFYKLVDKPSKGILTINTNGTFTYAPNKNVVGNDVFTYKTNDWQGESNIGMVNIEIFEFNHPPIANNITIATQKNHSFRGLFNATDIDNDDLTYKIITNPLHGTMRILTSGHYIYTPNNGFTGNDNFTYSANDGKNDSNIATVKITVSNIVKTIKQNAIINNNQNTQNSPQKTIIKQKNSETIAPHASVLSLPTNQTIKPQIPNTPNTNSILQNIPTEYILTLIYNTTNTLKQIIQQVTGQISKIGEL